MKCGSGDRLMMVIIFVLVPKWWMERKGEGEDNIKDLINLQTGLFKLLALP